MNIPENCFPFSWNSLPEIQSFDKHNLNWQILNHGVIVEISGKEKKIEPISNSSFEDVKLGTLKDPKLIITVFSIWKKN